MPSSILNQAGKGWTPGHYRSKEYRENFDEIFRKPIRRKVPEPANADVDRLVTLYVGQTPENL